MTDIKLNTSGQPISKSGIDCLITSDKEELLQELKNEALTEEGSLFYDSSYGWSLLEFKNKQITELDELELKQRIMLKLKKYNEINVETIIINIINYQDKLQISVSFNLQNTNENIKINISLDRINAEVIIDE